MPDIKHSVSIEASAEKIFPLIASPRGLSRWWAEDVAEGESGVVEISFFNRATVYRLRASRMAAPLEAEWACETGKDWSGTRLVFRLTVDGGRTQVRFTHAGWQSESDYFVDCTTTWGCLMYRLKAAAEDGVSAPLFSKTGLRLGLSGYD